MPKKLNRMCGWLCTTPTRGRPCNPPFEQLLRENARALLCTSATGTTSTRENPRSPPATSALRTCHTRERPCSPRYSALSHKITCVHFRAVHHSHARASAQFALYTTPMRERPRTPVHFFAVHHSHAIVSVQSAPCNNSHARAPPLPRALLPRESALPFRAMQRELDIQPAPCTTPQRKLDFNSS